MVKFNVLSFVAAAVLAVGTAQALPLAPGACIGAFPSPPPCTGFLGTSFNNSGLTLLAQQTQAVLGISGIFTGTVTSAVYQERTGTLDFLYQFANSFTSTEAVQQIVARSFTGYQADVSLASALVCAPGQGCTPFGTFVSGNSSPLSATRSLAGDMISFQGFGGLLLQPAPNIRPGETSAILMISTDATSYGAGVLTIVNSGSTQISSFAPSAVPEPGVFSLTIVGILAGVLAARSKPSERSQFQS
jgi:hypothetical protein